MLFSSWLRPWLPSRGFLSAFVTKTMEAGAGTYFSKRSLYFQTFSAQRIYVSCHSEASGCSFTRSRTHTHGHSAMPLHPCCSHFGMLVTAEVFLYERQPETQRELMRLPNTLCLWKNSAVVHHHHENSFVAVEVLCMCVIFIFYSDRHTYDVYVIQVQLKENVRQHFCPNLDSGGEIHMYNILLQIQNVFTHSQKVTHWPFFTSTKYYWP